MAEEYRHCWFANLKPQIRERGFRSLGLAGWKVNFCLSVKVYKWYHHQCILEYGCLTYRMEIDQARKGHLAVYFLYNFPGPKTYSI